MIKVIVKNPRPDFRVFGDLLFGFDRNVDSEGDAFPVCSREWRDLYLKDRESDEAHVELSSEAVVPLQFKVESKSQRLEELAALYLYYYITILIFGQIFWTICRFKTCHVLFCVTNRYPISGEKPYECPISKTTSWQAFHCD